MTTSCFTKIKHIMYKDQE